MSPVIQNSYQANPITWNVIYDQLKAYYDQHYFVKTFSFGQVDLMDLDKQTIFPLVHVIPGSVSIEKGVQTMNMEIMCADLLHQKENKEERMVEILSDTLRNLQDLDAEIRHGFTIFKREQEIEVDLPVSMTPFMEEYKNVLVGYNASYVINTPYQSKACIQPTDEKIDKQFVEADNMKPRYPRVPRI
tara:strand:- start:3357 stop:3920 length:564 start_codon:yes stop_codon:yes gene_type:complete